MSELTRDVLAKQVFKQLELHSGHSREMYRNTAESTGYFFIDDLLPHDVCMKLYEAFPAPKAMQVKQSMREWKNIAAQMNQYSPILEEAVYAFQDEAITRLISEITGVDDLIPDDKLYAGGISSMSSGHFLNPHLDNSHDKLRSRWRAFNLLFYVTPDWPLNAGGNLELWPNGLNSDPLVIHSKFNRLVVMATHADSWHSVSPIRFVERPRCCISNYYFRDEPLRKGATYHVTTFRGRPEQPVRDLILRFDNAIRQFIRKSTGEAIFKNAHYYDRDK